MRAYYKNDDNGGTVEQVSVAKAGEELFTALGSPLSPTGETVELMGWPDSKAAVYQTDLGATFYIP